MLAARSVEEPNIPESLSICVAPAERQAKIIAREIGQQLSQVASDGFDAGSGHRGQYRKTTFCEVKENLRLSEQWIFRP